MGALPVFFSLLHRGAEPPTITISFIFIDMSRRKRHSRELGSISYGLQCFGGIPFSHNFSTPRTFDSHPEPPSYPVTHPIVFFLMHLNLHCKQAVAACVNIFFFWFGCFSEKLCCSSYINTSGSLETLTSQVSIPACQKIHVKDLFIRLSKIPAGNCVSDVAR